MRSEIERWREANCPSFIREGSQGLAEEVARFLRCPPPITITNASPGTSAALLDGRRGKAPFVRIGAKETCRRHRFCNIRLSVLEVS